MIYIYIVFDKIFKEWIFYVLVFEGLVVFFIVLVLLLVMNKFLVYMGVLMLMFFIVVMFWNMFFNSFFDCVQWCMGFQCILQVWVLYVMFFELGLIVVLVLLVVWWLLIGLVEVFFFDMGLILFFLFYIMVFNWSYDVFCVCLVESCQVKVVGCDVGQVGVQVVSCLCRWLSMLSRLLICFFLCLLCGILVSWLIFGRFCFCYSKVCLVVVFRFFLNNFLWIGLGRQWNICVWLISLSRVWVLWNGVIIRLSRCGWVWVRDFSSGVVCFLVSFRLLISIFIGLVFSYISVLVRLCVCSR